MYTSIMDKLIEEIKTAFKNNEFCGNDNIVNPSYGEEAESIKKHFYGQNNWEMLASDFLDKDGALSFLTNEAFHFYLPAYMIADIRCELGFNDPCVRLCWAVTSQSETKKIAKNWGGGTIGEKATECFTGFSIEQISAIVKYLKWKYSHTNDFMIQQALDNYWLTKIE